jgi:hypothetical protein
MKVEGPHLDPNGWLEVRLLDVGGASKALFSAWPSGRPRVAKRAGEGRREVRFVWMEHGRAEDAGFICSAYRLHEFQISPQCVKLRRALYGQPSDKYCSLLIDW